MGPGSDPDYTGAGSEIDQQEAMKMITEFYSGVLTCPKSFLWKQNIHWRKPWTTNTKILEKSVQKYPHIECTSHVGLININL